MRLWHEYMLNAKSGRVLQLEHQTQIIKDYCEIT